MKELLQLLTKVLNASVPLATHGAVSVNYCNNRYTLYITDKFHMHFLYDGGIVTYMGGSPNDKGYVHKRPLITNSGTLTIDTSSLYRPYHMKQQSLKYRLLTTVEEQVDLLISLVPHSGVVSLQDIADVSKELDLSDEDIEDMSNDVTLLKALYLRNKSTVRIDDLTDLAIYKLLGVDLHWETFTGSFRVADQQHVTRDTTTMIINEFLENGTSRDTVAYLDIPNIPGIQFRFDDLAVFGVGTYLRSDMGNLYKVPEHCIVPVRGPKEFV